MNRTTKLTFLVVDDDIEIAAALEEALNRRFGADYKIIAESSPERGLAVLARLRDREEQVAVVIADEWMPQMTGVDFLLEAHQMHLAARRALLLDAFADRAQHRMADRHLGEGLSRLPDDRTRLLPGQHAARLPAAAPPAISHGDQHPRCLRGRRRAARISEAGGVRGRRRRDRDPVRTPAPRRNQNYALRPAAARALQVTRRSRHGLAEHHDLGARNRYETRQIRSQAKCEAM
jgi:CheY-like chemotaxis protein